jgi:transcriptional regulator with XRE-family HTH domain
MRAYEQAIHRYGNAVAFVVELAASMSRHGITQAQLARRTGINAQQLNRYLRGAAQPSIWTMINLDEALFELMDECANSES